MNLRKLGTVLVLAVGLGLPARGQYSVINVGTSPNDKTGDALRVAFQKINANFAALYGGVLSSNAIYALAQLSVPGGYPMTNLTSVGAQVGQIPYAKAGGGIGWSNAPTGGSGGTNGPLTSGEVLGALGYTPQVALGFTPLTPGVVTNAAVKASRDATNGLQSAAYQPTSAFQAPLGFTPLTPAVVTNAAVKAAADATAGLVGGGGNPNALTNSETRAVTLTGALTVGGDLTINSSRDTDEIVNVHASGDATVDGVIRGVAQTNSGPVQASAFYDAGGRVGGGGSANLNGTNAGDVLVYNGTSYQALPLGQFYGSVTSSNATPTNLVSLVIPTNMSARVRGDFIAAGATDTGGWTLDCTFRNTNGTIVLVKSNLLASATVDASTNWIPRYVPSGSTNLLIQAVGESSKINWRWQGCVDVVANATNAAGLPGLPAGTFYVSTSGSDANDGLTTGAPFLTVTNGLAHLTAGSTMALKGGDTFTETNMVLSTSGTLANPITITKYGAGMPVVRSLMTNQNVFTISNAAYVHIDGIAFGGQTNWGNYSVSPPSLFAHAVAFMAKSSSKLLGCSISNCVVTNAYGGIIFWSDGVGAAGFGSPAIVGNSVSNITASGIRLHSSVQAISPVHTNIYIGYNDVGWCTGDSRDNGSPFSVWTCQDGLVEYNVMHDSGNLRVGGSGAGGLVMSYDRNVIAQWNEAHRIHRSSDTAIDGIGIDFDTMCTNCIFQYNYCHNNDDAGIYYYGQGGGNVARWNLCVSNAVSTTTAGEIYLAPAGCNNWQIYNNTIIARPNQACIFIRGAQTGTNLLANNILWSNGGRQIDSDPTTNICVTGNDYYIASRIKWGGPIYTNDLAGFRTASGQETGTGLQVDPNFHGSVYGTLGDATLIPGMVNARLHAPSPLLGAGINLLSVYGINPGSLDLAGATVTAPYAVGCYAYSNAAFAPPSGLLVWVSADQKVYNDAGTTAAVHNDLVQVMKDRSGHAFDFSSPYTQTRGLLRGGEIGLKPVISMNSTTNYMTNSFGAVNGQPLYVFVMANLTNTGTIDPKLLFDSRDSVNRINLSVSATTGTFNIAAPTNIGTAASPIAVPCLFEAYYNGASSTGFTNGVQALSGNPGANGAAGITLNARYSLEQLYAGMKFAELMMFTNLPSAPDLASVRNYFWNKYGTSHP